MRVYLSSTFKDLADHRAAAIQIMRQLGHEVVGMEDYTAESVRALDKVLEHIPTCDAVVLLVAWRYGYVPEHGPKNNGANAQKTSITEYEYRQALATDRPVLAFLLDDLAPWPVQFIDAMSDADKASAVHRLREELKRDWLAAFFTTPESLASQVAAALSAQRMRKEIMQHMIAPLSREVGDAFMVPGQLDESTGEEIVDWVSTSTTSPTVEIDLEKTWWSTRLYLLAAMGQELSALQRIIIYDHGKFVGAVSTGMVRLVLRRIHPEVDRFDQDVLGKQLGADRRKTAERFLQEWRKRLNDPVAEEEVKVNVDAPRLKDWFADALVQAPLRIAGFESASPLTLLRIIDYPNDFVPVLDERAPRVLDENGQEREAIRVVNKKDLSERLAHQSVTEILDRLGLH